jgi:hypothetical protein
MRRRRVRKIVIGAAWVMVMLLGGCGGGGGGGSTSGNGGSTNPIAAAAANVQAVTIGPGPAGIVNGLFTNVTVCIPGSATCQTIDQILVDTGSSGLRIMASVLQSSLVLPQQTDSGGNLIAECAQFADGFTWGPLKIADVKISGEQAAAVPIQIIGDPAFSAIPNDCANTGPSENTVASFGANGVLGVGVFKEDCGSTCLNNGNGFYYLCPCQPNMQSSGLGLDLQVQNPVALFANDNNGVVIELPGVPSNGAASVNGSLVFGIDTQANNQLGSAQVFKVKPDTGTFITTYNNKIYNLSLIDSGSSIYFFSDSNIHVCGQSDPYAPGYFCPTSTQNLAAEVQGTDGASAAVATVAFNVANAHDLFSQNPSNWVFNNLGAPDILPNSFIWGLPAFMGRNVFTAIEGQNTLAGQGPYFAF